MKIAHKNYVTLMYVCLLAFSFFITACGDKDGQVKNQSVRIVDIQQVIINSGLAEQEAEHLKSVRKTLADGLTLAQAQYENLPEEKKNEAKQNDNKLIEYQWQNERFLARKAVGQTIQNAIDKWRIKNNISIIIPRQQALSLDKGLDITPLIVKELKGAKVKFGELPVISLKQKENSPSEKENG